MMSQILPDLPSSHRRQLLQLAGAGMITLLAPLQAQAQTWRQVEAVRHSVGDKPFSNDGLELTLPLVAEDGSSVPLAVQSNKSGQGNRISRLEIFAPNNPTPQVAVFEFGVEIENVDLATRIRLSESQTVIAIGHTANGHVYVAERPVRVTTSGCVAPAQPDPNTEMQARVRVPASWKPGAAAEVLTMISHPMITGLAQDPSGNTPATRIIDQFEVTLDGRSLVRAQFFRSLAANPYLKFGVTPKEAGELHFRWTEDTGRSVKRSENLRTG